MVNMMSPMKAAKAEQKANVIYRSAWSSISSISWRGVLSKNHVPTTRRRTSAAKILVCIFSMRPSGRFAYK